MLKQGAKLVETPEEILEELGFVPAPARAAGPMPWGSVSGKPAPATMPESAPGIAAGAAPAIAPAAASAPQPAAIADLGPEAEKLLAALGHAPATLEILAARTDMQDATLQSTLLQLELAGRLTVLPGGRFARVSHR
ncbi:MAG: DNA-protecting protein DprA, partial [Paraburkholderia sp.]